MKHPIFFKGPFYPDFSQYKLGKTLNLEKSRNSFILNRFSNLDFLLKNRYDWMNKYIHSDDVGIELGCGIGVSKLYIHNQHLSLTDVIENPWVEKVVDALDMPYADSSLDYIIAVNMIHHLSNPARFFKECSRVLKPKGQLLIQDANLSFLLRVLLRIMAHEGYDYDCDVFSSEIELSDPESPWTANNAVANLLFDDINRFENNFSFILKRKHYAECFMLPLSGGVSFRSFAVPLPNFILELIRYIDNGLVKLSPSFFAMAHRIVLHNAK